MSKGDKEKISRTDQVDSVAHMLYLVGTCHTQMLGVSHESW